MNLFNEYRKPYIAVCFAIAAIYAFALGSLSVSHSVNILIFCIVDWLIYGAILCLTIIMLFNVFRFVTPANNIIKYRLISACILATFTCLCVIAAETLAIYIFFPSEIGTFAYSIPIRLFITLLIFIIVRLFYDFYIENPKINNLKDDKISTQDNLQSTNKVPIDRITVRNGQKIIIIPVDEITFIKADGDYIAINTIKGFWLKEQTMKYTENILPITNFVRIHRSYIVNINHISRIERYGEQQQVVMHNNEKIKISTARYQILKQIMGL